MPIYACRFGMLIKPDVELNNREEIEQLERQLAEMELQLLEREIVETARSSFLSFCRYMKPELDYAWFHLLIIKTLQDLIDFKLMLNGKLCRNVILSMPPQCGKTTFVSELFPAWLFGRDPNQKLVTTSYSSERASDCNRAVQKLIDTPDYKAVYPDTVLPMSNTRTLSGKLRNNDIFELVGAKGHYISAGILGGITGRGGDLIIDDPIKNFEEANSPTYRDKIDNEYKFTLKTRPKPDGFKIIVQTRWHEDDLAGRRLAAMENDTNAEQWKYICIQALKEDPDATFDPRKLGEPIWPASGRDLTWAERVKAEGMEAWNALYQQRPVPLGGGLIKTYNFGFWYSDGPVPTPYKLAGPDGTMIEIPQMVLPRKIPRKLQSWDMSFKDLQTSDYVVGEVWGTGAPECPAFSFLLDLWRNRADFEATLTAFRNMCAKHPDADEKLIEDKANGPAVVSAVKRFIPGVIEVTPEGSKVSRVNAVSPYIDGKNVWLPHPAMFPWVLTFLTECARFPKGKNDDQVDSMTQALQRLYTKKPFTLY